ncbi:hypothetical protein HDE_00531 [Halotydeus destructor]|nr:hypothetical protein HDE_00531 [Halotydeus destructor]
MIKLCLLMLQTYTLCWCRRWKTFPHGYTRCGEPPIYKWAPADDHGGRFHGDILKYECNSFVNQCVDSFQLHCKNGLWSSRKIVDAPPLLADVVMVNISCGRAYRVFHVETAERGSNPYLIYDQQDGVNISTENIPCVDEDTYLWPIHLTNETRIGYLRVEMTEYLVRNINTIPSRICRSHDRDRGVNLGYFKCPLRDEKSADRATDRIIIKTFSSSEPIQLLKLYMAGPAEHCGQPQIPPYLQWDKQLDGKLELGHEWTTKCNSVWSTVKSGHIQCKHDGLVVIKEPICAPVAACPELAPMVRGCFIYWQD